MPPLSHWLCFAAVTAALVGAGILAAACLAAAFLLMVLGERQP